MDEDDQKYRDAKRRVAKLRSFYSNLITFILVNILLMIINLVINPQNLWFYWVTLIWGIIIIVQAFNTFTIRDSFLGAEWEKKKMDQLMRHDDEDDEDDEES
ncbi:MAG: 2TM domain-containing protein [Chlamydiales bacterium]